MYSKKFFATVHKGDDNRRGDLINLLYGEKKTDQSNIATCKSGYRLYKFPGRFFSFFIIAACFSVFIFLCISQSQLISTSRRCLERQQQTTGLRPRRLLSAREFGSSGNNGTIVPDKLLISSLMLFSSHLYRVGWFFIIGC